MFTRMIWIGNRVSETDTTSSGSVTQNSVYNANDELTSVTNTSTGDVQNYSYDADGNTTKVEDGDGTVLQTYSWDPQRSDGRSDLWRQHRVVHLQRLG